MRHHRGQNVVDSRGALFTATSTSKKMFLRAEKGIIASHIDRSRVVWTRIDNGVLAIQIAGLVALVPCLQDNFSIMLQMQN